MIIFQFFNESRSISCFFLENKNINSFSKRYRLIIHVLPTPSLEYGMLKLNA